MYYVGLINAIFSLFVTYHRIGFFIIRGLSDWVTPTRKYSKYTKHVCLLYRFYVLLYVTLLSAPGQHCRAALYKFIL